MSAAVAPPRPAPTNDWAADEDDIADGEVKLLEEREEPGGVKATVTLQLDPDTGKKIKVTKKVRRTLVRSQVSSSAMARQAWAGHKFGQERGSAPGLAGGHHTTTVAENAQLKLYAGGALKPEAAEPAAEEPTIKTATAGKILCRYCRGDHFTSRCPYKETLAPAVDGGELGDPADPTGSGAGTANPALNDASNPAVAASSSSRRYVAPGQRAAEGGGSRFGPASMGGMNRDEAPTLRVSNLSEEVEENDLRDLFGRFGRVTRVFVGRDRETGRAKGFAFVSFELFSDADLARQKIDGFGYANLILSVNWSQPRGEKPATAGP